MRRLHVELRRHLAPADPRDETGAPRHVPWREYTAERDGSRLALWVSRSRITPTTSPAAAGLGQLGQMDRAAGADDRRCGRVDRRCGDRPPSPRITPAARVRCRQTPAQIPAALRPGPFRPSWAAL